MGNITKDMERLCDEIQVSRASRADMKTLIAKNNDAIKNEVSNMRLGFVSDHKAMAAKSQKDRHGYISDLKKDVKSVREDTAKDLAGARKAWAELSGNKKTRKKNY